MSISIRALLVFDSLRWRQLPRTYFCLTLIFGTVSCDMPMFPALKILSTEILRRTLRAYVIWRSTVKTTFQVRAIFFIGGYFSSRGPPDRPVSLFVTVSLDRLFAPCLLSIFPPLFVVSCRSRSEIFSNACRSDSFVVNP